MTSMSGSRECVIDTMVLQIANTPMTSGVPPRGHFKLRLDLLEAISTGRMIILASQRLIAEYQRQLVAPRNETIKVFFELLTGASSNCVVWNWKKRWSLGEQERARHCRYPRHDDHLLRTAIRDNRSATVVTEESALLNTNDCIYRSFRVHILRPASVVQAMGRRKSEPSKK